MERVIDTFEAIKDFVNDLDECFTGEGNIEYNLIKPFYLYKRLVCDKITPSNDKKDVEKAVVSFMKFIDKNQKNILSLDLELDTQTKIHFSFKTKNIYIPLGLFYYESDAEIRYCIHNHLMNILFINYPEKETEYNQLLKEFSDKAKIFEEEEEELEDPDVFVKKLINSTKKQMSKKRTGGDFNPREFATDLMTSGVLSDMMNGVPKYAQNKDDACRLLDSFKNGLGELYNEDEDD